MGFDETDSELFPDSDDVAVTSGWRKMDDFIFVIQDALDVGYNAYLFYDDERAFRRVCERLQDRIENRQIEIEQKDR